MRVFRHRHARTLSRAMPLSWSSGPSAMPTGATASLAIRRSDRARKGMRFPRGGRQVGLTTAVSRVLSRNPPRSTAKAFLRRPHHRAALPHPSRDRVRLVRVSRREHEKAPPLSWQPTSWTPAAAPKTRPLACCDFDPLLEAQQQSTSGKLEATAWINFRCPIRPPLLQASANPPGAVIASPSVPRSRQAAEAMGVSHTTAHRLER